MTRMSIAQGGIRQLGVCLGLLGFVFAPYTLAEIEEKPINERDAFKVCSDAYNMPYSNDKGEGFENKIAELFADDLGMELDYYYFSQRVGFVRNTLRREIKDGVAACDVWIGVPKYFDQAATTMSYYRSSYLLVYRGDWEYADEVNSAEDLANLSEDKKESVNFGVFDRGPGQLWAFRNGFTTTGYQSMPGDARVSVTNILDDMVEGKITHTIIWGPIGGWWVQNMAGDTELKTHILRNDPDYPDMQFEFEMSMAARYEDHYMRSTLDYLIDTYMEEINEILEEYNVPLLPLED